MQVQAGKQHKIKANFKTFFQLRIAQSMPLSKQKAFKKQEWIITRGAKLFTNVSSFEKQGKTEPINQLINLN